MEQAIAALVLGSIVWSVPFVLLAALVLDTRAQVARLRAQLKQRDARPPEPAPPGAAGSGTAVPAPETVAAMAVPVGEPGPAPEPGPPPATEPVAPPPPAVPRPAPRPARPPLELPSPERLVAWVAASLAGIAGLLGTLLALVAIAEQGWFGPAMRVSLAFVGGTALWVGGAVASRLRWRATGSALAGAGIGTLYGAAYAGSGLYHLFSPEVTGPLMIAITVVGTLRAWRHDDRFVAWLSLAGGLLTPILVSTGQNRPYHLFAYLVLLVGGMLLASSRRGWWEVVLAAGLGVCGLYTGWTVQWYVADQVPAGLVGALVLQLPFVLTSRSGSLPVKVAATAMAVMVALNAIPWLVSVDATFVDPRSGFTVVRGAVRGPWPVALTTLVLTVPLFALGRRGGRWDTWAPLVPATVLSFVATFGFMAADVSSAPLLTVAAGPALLAAAVTWGRRESAFPVALLLPGSALAMASAFTWLSPAAVGLAPLLTIATALLVRRSEPSGWVNAVAVASTAVLSVLGAASLEGHPLRMLAAGLIAAWFVWGLAPVRGALPSLPTVAWLAAAATPVVVFPLFHAAWRSELGDRAIGALPVLLGTTTLLATSVLVRRQRFRADDWRVSVFVLVIVGALTLAVPLQLRERWLTVGWALEAAVLLWLADRVRLHDLVRLVSIALSFAVGVRLLLNPWALSWGRAGGWPILNWTLYSWGVPMAALLLVARWLKPRSASDPIALMRVPVLLLALLVGFGLVNVEISHAFRTEGPLALDLFGGDRVESMVRSAGWAGYGLAILASGLWADRRLLRFVGFTFVLLATAKVFLVDLWDLTGFVRVGSLFCLAVSLLVAAFAFERLVLRSTRRAAESP